MRAIDPGKDWQDLISKLSAPISGLPRAILVCGPKSSGKSTFTRQLVNGFLTWIHSRTASEGVGLLDIDPGQPEFSPPGQISLLHLRSYILSPPFTHPLINNDAVGNLVREHHLGALAPNFDPAYYTSCAKDLEGHYQQLLSSHVSCPLIINCSGWTFGGGLDILIELIRCFRITDVVYMSTSGPKGVIERLKGETSRAEIPFHMLTSQPCEHATQTASDLRMMQTFSYFHASEAEGDEFQWDHSAIHSMEPLALKYAGLEQMLFGIMVPGEELDLLCLADLIDGSVLGVVVIEDESIVSVEDAVSGIEDGHLKSQDIRTLQLLDGGEFNRSAFGLPKDGSYNHEHGNTLESSMKSPVVAISNTIELEHSNIRRTREGLPYYFRGIGSCIPLDPTKSRSIGQVLVHAINKSTKELLVITPIPKTLFAELRKNKTRIILVRGMLDLPTWSYLENRIKWLTAKERGRKEHNTAERSTSNDGSDSDLPLGIGDGTGKADWVTVTHGRKNQDRRKDKVWKVRRNLQMGDLKGSQDG